MVVFSKPTNQREMAIGSICVGSAVFLFGLFQAFEVQNFLRNAQETDAVITDTHTAGSAHPVAKWTFSGESKQGSVHSGLEECREGEHIRILVDRQSPNDVRVDAAASLYGFAALEIVLGLIPITIGLKHARKAYTSKETDPRAQKIT